jgi:hypothetical protein
MNEDQKSLEEKILLACEATALSLEDSPKSKAMQIYNHVGFYQGFCAAKQWEANIDLVMKMVNLVK